MLSTKDRLTVEPAQTGAGLRGQRRKTMDAMKARPNVRKYRATTGQEEKEDHWWSWLW